jgi:hypothetical protein
MSGISVVHSRHADLRKPKEIRETKRRAKSIPVVKGATRIVYARQLKDLQAGEQLVIKADVVTSAAHPAYPARATVEVLLAEDPTQPQPGPEARRITAIDGRICPRNGKNCVKAESPMTSFKAGVLRIEKKARKALHVIAVLQTGDPHGKAKRGDELRIADGGSLRILRYGPEMAG